jgi:hypothetical protein
MIWLVVNLASPMTLLLLDHPSFALPASCAQLFNASSGGTMGKEGRLAGTRAVRAEESISIRSKVIVHTR